jgi:hypothetical protein
VAATGTILTSSGIASISHPSTGIYCITLAAGTGANPAVASVGLTIDGPIGATAVLDPADTDCAAGQAEVFTLVLTAGATATDGSPLSGAAHDDGFTILFP